MVNAILSRRRITAPRGERAADVILEGIKRNDWRVRPSAAPELGAALAERGEIAYWVVAPESEPTPSRRAASRERTRLRPAELLDAALRFGCEHGICDRSLTRLRIALARDAVRLQERTSARAVNPRDRFVLSELY